MISEFLLKGATSGIQTTEKTGWDSSFAVHLVPDTTAMFTVNQMTEVLTIPIAQIVPDPQMPAWVMGVYNW